MTDLTSKQREILEFIKSRQQEVGFPPSVREIAQAVLLSSPSSVQHHINFLIKSGHLQRESSKPRTLTFGQNEAKHSGRGSQAKTDESSYSLVEVPLIGDVAAGFGTLAEQSKDGDVITLPTSLVGRQHGLFALTVRGQSMIDIGIHDGDQIVAREQSVAKNGDLVVAGINGGEEGTVKVFRNIGGKAFLEARNSSDPRFKEPIFMDSEGDKIYGVVVALLRSY